MKTKNILTFTAGLLLITLLVSCDKGDDYTPSDKELLPSNIISHWSNADPSNPKSLITATTIEYNSQNQFAKVITSSEYNGDKGAVFTESFIYDGDDITVTTTRSDQPEYNVVKIFRRVGSQIIINGDNDNPINIDNNFRSTRYTYDSKGNVREYEGSLSYDKENGIFRYVNMPSWYLTTQFKDSIGKLNLYNNCVKQMNSSESGHGYTCKYNADNYPVVITRVPIQILGSVGSSSTIEYIEAN